MAPGGGATWHYDMELEINLAALRWGMRISDVSKLPRDEIISMLATIKAKSDMDYVNAMVK